VARKVKARPQLVEAGEAAQPARRRNSENLFQLAYEKLEERIVTCELKPGQFLAIQDLQDEIGFGRTPTHQAVNRLAGDTLIIVRPRQGLQIAPIDLSRERLLLQLRRDLERFVVRLAAERSGTAYRNQLLHLTRGLRERRDRITIGEFNLLDLRIDRLMLAAAAEPFLEHTLRPLHTIFRRIGWIYHSWIAPKEGLHKTVDCHLAIMEAVANRHPDEAAAASDRLIAFSDSMFGLLEREIDPTLLDCSVEPLIPM
jgi:DNA-binding GntR family transcriptional regulator